VGSYVDLSHRVVARYLRADSYGDPSELLRKYEAQVAEYAKLEQVAIGWLEGYRELERLRATRASREEQDAVRERHMVTDVTKDAQGRFKSYKDLAGGPVRAVIREGRSGWVGATAKEFCLGLLQQFALPAGVRKSIEASSTWWHKAVRLPRGKTYEEGEALGVELYLDHLKTFRKYEKVYADAVRIGKAHSGEGEGATRVVAGPFTVVNTGGFSTEVMARSAKVAIVVAQRMEGIGLGKVCYGDLHLSGKLMGKNVAAFYSPGHDEMFIRPNIPGDAIRYICHELTHRLVNKHLRSKQSEIAQLYGNCKATGRFVSPYARKGGPEENFCEMVSFWALGMLHPDMIALLRDILVS
jgi:hypothetical protein